MTEGIDPAKQVSNCVEIAIRLGWRMAQVYHKPPRTDFHADEPDRDPPDHLPGERELGSYERGRTLLAENQHGIASLEKAIEFKLSSKKELTHILKEQSDVEKRKSLLAVHRELHRKLAEYDPRFARGFDLGRMLADTVLLSDPMRPETILYEFNHYRLGNAYLWLNDLHSLLPERASYAVSGTLMAWQDWVDGNKGVIPTDASSQGRFHQALHDQGESWRQLLCGEKPGKDYLTADNYNSAGNRVTKRFLSMIFGFIRGWWYAIALCFMALAVVGVVIVQFTPAHRPLFPAVILTTATALGISWKTVTATLGKVAKRAEGPLWEAEVNEAIVLATTHLPNFKERTPISSAALYAFPSGTIV